MPLIPQHVPAQMLTEIAFGLERPVAVAYRHGYSPEDYELLEQQDWFTRQIEIKKAELRASGWTSKQRFTMMAEDLMEQCYKYATASDNTQTKLEVAKYAAKLADIEPKNNAPNLGIGTGFSININLSGSKNKNITTIDAAPKTTYGLVDLPPAPSYLSILPFESLTESPTESS